jgi:hypothetical protein
MLIGLIDADLIAGKHRIPNLALMKISSQLKRRGREVELVTEYKDLARYTRLYIAKIFTDTPVPREVLDLPNIIYGGTGFLYDQAIPLPSNVEHLTPDYSLYESWATTTKISKTTKEHYLDFSYGFTTRYCFRKCPWCVNRNYDRAVIHSPVFEFVDRTKKKTYLLDDNLFAAGGAWRQILDELDATKIPYQYIQGNDLRLMTPEIAKRLSEARWFGDFIFAFDDPKDEPEIRKKLSIWRDHCGKDTKLYTLCAYESIGADDIDNLFYRFSILAEYNAAPYVMRFENYAHSLNRGMYVALASWANQPHIYHKMSFREFCEAKAKRYGEKAPLRYAEEFAKREPKIARRWFDWRYDSKGERRKL